MMSRAMLQKKHALRRLAQHYRLVLNDRDYAAICEWIQHHDWPGNDRRAKFLCRTSRRVTHWAIYCAGRWIPVLYDGVRHSIITVLPPAAFHKPRYQEAVRHHNL